MPLIARLQRAVTDEPPRLSSSTLWLGALVVVPTLLRLALNPLLGSTLWYPTYYPAALIGTLLLGWQAGLILILLCAIVANYFFIPPAYSAAVNQETVAGTIVFLLAAGLIVLAAAVLRSTLIRLQAANDLEARLNAELQHRMKNTLAIIQAVVRQTANRYSDPKEFQCTLEGRIVALSQAHDLLSDGRWELCGLPLLAERALTPFQDDGRIAVSGPACALKAECCVPLVLALHELATNSFKYGALSEPQGTVKLTWLCASEKVTLWWFEKNGPAVTKPTRRGLGSVLLSTQKGLEVTVEYKPSGLECRLTVSRATPQGPRRGVINPGQTTARPEGAITLENIRDVSVASD